VPLGSFPAARRVSDRRLRVCVLRRMYSILYQRGLYPPESFEKRNAHGASVLVATHPGLRDYLAAVLRQLAGATRTSRLSSQVQPSLSEGLSRPPRRLAAGGHATAPGAGGG